MHARKTGDASRSDDAAAPPYQNGQNPGDPSTGNAPRAIANHSTSFMPLASRASIEPKATRALQGDETSWQPELARAELGKSLFEVAYGTTLCRTRPQPSSLQMEVPDGVATDDGVTIGSSLDQSAAESLVDLSQARHYATTIGDERTARSRPAGPAPGTKFRRHGSRFRGTRGGSDRSGHLDLGVAQCRSGCHSFLVTLIAHGCRAENGPKTLR